MPVQRPEHLLFGRATLLGRTNRLVFGAGVVWLALGLLQFVPDFVRGDDAAALEIVELGGGGSTWRGWTMRLAFSLVSS